jgi:UPF0755 protein
MQQRPTPKRAARHDDVKDRPRRTSLIVVFLLFLLLVGGGVAAANRYQQCKSAPDGSAKKITFTVEDGASASVVVEDLTRAGLIRCGGFVGNLLMRGTGKASQIRAGTYTLTLGMSLDEIITVMTTPPPKVASVNVLVPPGYRVSQTAARFQDTLGIPAKDFIADAESGTYALEPYLPEGSSTVEGFLFPETYRFAKKGSTSHDVISRLLDQFQQDVQGLPWANAKQLGASPYEIVTIASMIEEEAKVDGDRAKIAAVIYNRLAAGMTLGIDATVGYIDPDPSNGLTDADLAIDSPYNTRLNRGLPPTPISSPGLESLRAALAPADVGYFYYVACGSDGAHRFSTDYNRFLADKAACLG